MPEEQKTNQKKTPETAKPIGDNADTSFDASSFQETLNQSLSAYLQAITEVYNAAYKKLGDLYQEYLREQNRQQMMASEGLKEDYRDFIGKLQQIWGQENAQPQFEESNRDYYRALNERQVDLGKSAEENFSNFVETLREYREQSQEQYVTAFQDYARGFQANLQKLDPTTVDADTWAAIGQLNVTAAGYFKSAVQANGAIFGVN